MPKKSTCNNRNPNPPCLDGYYEKKNPKNDTCCYKVPKKKTKKQSTVAKVPKAAKVKIGKVHRALYLSHLYSEGYISELRQELYKKPFSLSKREGFIPFNIIDEIIPRDMKTQYQDADVGKSGNKRKVYPVDSANWYKDSKKFKKNDVIYDPTPGSSLFTRLSRSDFEAWLVVEEKGKLGLVMFPMSDGSPKYFDKGLSDGDTVNSRNEMIHPITKELVKI
jgi:hypothetical protein